MCASWFEGHPYGQISEMALEKTEQNIFPVTLTTLQPIVFHTIKRPPHLEPAARQNPSDLKKS